jgi:hypothetical protein
VVHPRDLAKLGQLFLDGGLWNGKRIVSEAWVTDAITSHASFGDGTGYGLGWWIEHDPTPGGGEFGAVGRGGQFVTVTVTFDLVVVLTGGAGDFDDSDVTALVTPAIVDPTGPLPANPDAVARLAATLEMLQTPPEPQLVAQPDTAATVSGARLVFEPGNVIGLESLRLTFDGSAEADLEVTFANGLDPSPAQSAWTGSSACHPAGGICRSACAACGPTHRRSRSSVTRSPTTEPCS